VKIVARNAWANLWHGVTVGSDHLNPMRDLWAVQTLDDTLEGQDKMHHGPKRLVVALFKREITVDEFYEEHFIKDFGYGKRCCVGQSALTPIELLEPTPNAF